MRTTQSFCPLVLFTALLAAAPAAAQNRADLPALIERVRPAVVQIRTFDAQGEPLGSGSGFYGPDGRVVTNAHVLQGAARAEVFDADGRLQGTTQFAEASSTTVDLAVLPRMGSPAVTLPLAASPARIGEGVVVIGSPLGLANTVSDGLVSGIRTEDGQQLLQISAPISRGSSGGPVLNGAGEVIGVAVSLLEGGQNLNFAVPASDVQAMLQSPAGRYAFQPEAPPRVSPGGESQGVIRRPTRPSVAEGAANWLLSSSWDDKREYINRAEIRVLPSGNVEVLVGRTHASPFTDSLGDTYNLELLTYELDCRRRQTRLVNLTQFLDDDLVYASPEDMGSVWRPRTREEWLALETYPMACRLAGQ